MRLSYFSRLAAVAAVTIFGTQIASANPAPKTVWQVQIAEGSCTLTGKIPGPEPMEVSLFTVAGSDSYRLSFSGKNIRHARDRDSFPVTVALGGVAQRFERTAWGNELTGDRGNVVFVNGLGLDMVAAFGRASSIGLEGKWAIAPQTLTGTPTAATALVGCVRDQLVAWGADPAQFAANGNTPMALSARTDWLTGRDWDRAMPGNRVALDMVLKLAVATDGRVDGCSAIEPAPPAATQALCDALINRRLYTPAHDASGRPVRGVSTFDIHLGAE